MGARALCGAAASAVDTTVTPAPRLGSPRGITDGRAYDRIKIKEEALMHLIGLARVLAFGLVIAVLPASTALLRPEVAEARQHVVDPRDVALTPADLPLGFVVTPDATRSGALLVAVADVSQDEPLKHEEHDVAVRQVGDRLETELRRPPSAEALQAGDITVRQTITRVDSFIVPADLLTESRDRLIRHQGFALLPGTSDDGAIVELVKQTDSEVVYAVGVVRRDMVILTSLSGPEPAVEPDLARALTAKSSAKYDLLTAEATATASPAAASADSGIEGRVFTRVACPGIEREELECRDRPYEATITILDDVGNMVTRVQTDEEGRFRVSLEPGIYVLRPEPSGPFSSAGEQAVTVARSRFVNVGITYDTDL